MKTVNIVTQILLIIGGLNWLLVGAFQFDLVAAIFGSQAAILSRIIYILMGASALWQITRLGALMSDDHTHTHPPQGPGGRRL